MANMQLAERAQPSTYSQIARSFHWITAVVVILMIPTGIYMVRRGKATNFDDLTNLLYSYHKLAGFLLLWLIVARLAYRLVKGAPPAEPTLSPAQKTIAHATHWGLYGLLLAVPVLGWLGVSLFPALGVPGGFSLPGLVTPNQSAASGVFFWHMVGGFVMGGLVLVHTGAALFHHIVQKDNVLRRMLPNLPAR